MGLKYLWDTNTAIYYLQQQFPPNAEAFIDELLKDGSPVISAITEIELLCWKTSSEKDLNILRSFIEDAVVIELEQGIKVKTAGLRKTNRIKMPDAIIAATALEYNLTLLTRNLADFANIPNLFVIDPWQQ
jgi:predicted nucleic acid-binding protein